MSNFNARKSGVVGWSWPVPPDNDEQSEGIHAMSNLNMSNLKRIETPMSRRRFVGAGAAMSALAFAVGTGAAGAFADESDNDAEGSGDDQGAEPMGGTHAVTDGRGEQVEVPDGIRTVAVAQVPIAATYVMFNGGSAEGLIGLDGSVLETVKKTLLPTIAPEILDVDTSFYDNGDLNVESLAALHPDIVLFNAYNDEHRTLFEQAGLAHLGFNTSGDPTKIYQEWPRELEATFQDEGRMDEVIDYGQKIIDMVDERTSGIAEEDRKRVMILFNMSQGTPMVAGGNHGEGIVFGAYWLEHIGAVNVADEVVGAGAVDMEQIYAWGPDIIFVNGAGLCSVTADQVLANEVDGADFSPLSAVRAGEVFSCELGMWAWFTVNSDAPLVCLWLASTVYPELFEDVDLVEETRAYYKLAYNYELSDDEIAGIYTGAFGD